MVHTIGRSINMSQSDEMSLTSVNTGGDLKFRIVLLETEVARLQFQNALQEQELEQYKIQMNKLIEEIVALKTKSIHSDSHSDISQASSIMYDRRPQSPINIIPGEHGQHNNITRDPNEQCNGATGFKELLAQASKVCENPFCMLEGLYHDGACQFHDKACQAEPLQSKIEEVFDWKNARLLRAAEPKGALYAAGPHSTSPHKMTSKRSGHSHKSRTTRKLLKTRRHQPTMELQDGRNT